jgi:hypothetical protein
MITRSGLIRGGLHRLVAHVGHSAALDQLADCPDYGDFSGSPDAIVFVGVCQFVGAENPGDL